MFTARYEIYENFTLQEVIRGLPQSYIKCPNLHGLLHALNTADIKTQPKFSTNSDPPPAPPRPPPVPSAQNTRRSIALTL